MQRSTHRTENISANRTAIDPRLGDLTVYRDVGLDTDGRAYFFAPESDQVVVTDTDRRGRGVRDSDVVATIDLGNKTVDQYCRFVRDESEREWSECDWLEAV
jgi:hypothetical protein